MIKVEIGRIEEQNADVIVNSTNSEMLWEDTTVNGWIHKKAGKEYTIHCLNYIKEKGLLKTNDIVITPSFNMNCKYIFNVYTPYWQSKLTKYELYQNLFFTYNKIFDEFRKTKLKTIVFPLLSSGTFLYPIDLALACALDSFELNKDILSKLILYDKHTYNMYENLINKL